jgi:uncharacterized protein YcbK (DUF882 family)
VKRLAILLAAFVAMCAIVLAIPARAGGDPERLRWIPAVATMTRLPSDWGRSARPVPDVPHPPGRLAMQAIGREDRLDVEPFDGRGQSRPNAFTSIREFFRSRRGTSVEIDPRLVSLLGMIARHYDDRPLMLVSGYRDPLGHGRNGSYHLRGMAADIAVPGVPAFTLYKLAVKLGARGAGLYASFVHVDVRDVPYRWTGR